MDIGHWGRESIILRDAKPIDPDAELEKRISDRAREVRMSHGGESGVAGKDKRRDKGKGKKGRRDEEREEEATRGAEAAQNDLLPSERAGLSTYNDIPSGNGERARSKEEDHYGFLYSISEADRH